MALGAATSEASAWDRDWASRGACRNSDPDALFVQGAAQNRAKLVCGGCPVRTECLAEALDNRTEFGVWGGMTERERRALLRRRPDVESWTAYLQDAKRDFETATRKPGSAVLPAQRGA
nr:WhiB family transcriptional regulator [Motilibacter rhizosphaerae]